jgi:VCBS repeat-containing protein
MNAKAKEVIMKIINCCIAITLIAVALFVGGSTEVQAATCTVTNLSDSGVGSLRQAILDANANPGPDTIVFEVAGTINVSSQLPELSDGGTTIDGTTAPGYTGSPVVVLRGGGWYPSGLKITSANNIVRGLQIDSFRYCARGAIEIVGSSASGNVIAGNFIGDVGAVALPNFYGIYVDGSPNNRIGSDGDGVDDAAEGNLISGNYNGAVYIIGTSATGNTIAGNLIGTDYSGTVALLPSSNHIRIEDAPANTIGGTTPGARNVIVRGYLRITGSDAIGNVVQGNFFGTDITGTIELGGNGIQIRYGASGNLIGGTVSGARNIIVATSSDGVLIEGEGVETTDNLVQGNLIGTDVTGTIALGSGRAVTIVQASNNTIGGTTSSARNILAATSQGVWIGGLGATGNVVQGNFIGTDITGTHALNNYDGIWISGHEADENMNNIIGGTEPGAGNLISGCAYDGIVLLDDSGGNIIQGNFIGTDVTGTISLPNGRDGIRIYTPRNTIGGNTPGAGNVICSNGGEGINIPTLVDNTFNSGNLVQGNYIGTDKSGTRMLGNTGNGVKIGGMNTTVGGPPSEAANTIAFNGGDGVVSVNVENTIRFNSIFSNSGLGIDIADNGVSINDPGDTNFEQNFPVITSATFDGANTTISGIINSKANTTFLIDLYGNTTGDPSGYGEGETYLGTTTSLTDGAGNGTWTLDVAGDVTGLVLSSTATDPTGNTSEFSAPQQTNTAPMVVDDAYNVNEDNTLNVEAPGVLGNDTDAESDPLMAILVSDVSHGTLTLNADGSFTYTPDADFNGTDTFTYKANDGTADSDPATVTITVDPVNDAPVANDQSVTTDEDTAVSITLTALDVDGDVLTYRVVTPPAYGSLSGTAPNLTYTPDLNYNGSDSFTYKANDGTVDSTVATVSITIRAVNDAPVAVDDAYSVDEDAALTVPASGVLTNDTDVEGDALTAVLVSGVSNGALTLHADGSFTYTPNADFNGMDSFTYKANDGTVDSDPATVTITVDPVNDAPVAADDTYSVDEDSTLTVGAPGVLSNDIDVDGDSLTAILVSPPANGTLTFNVNGSFTYEPDHDFNGTDSFSYQANDGTATSNVATVTIAVNSVNDAPVAENDIAETDENVPVDIDVLANDSDVDDDTLTVISVTDGANGTVAILDGSVRYSPNVGFAGEDSFTYTISDGNGGTATATVAVTVIPANKPPTASAGGPYSGDEGSAIVLSGASASDPDNDPLTISWGVDSALCSFDDATALKPTLTCDDNGSYIVTLTVDDGVNDPVSSSADVTVNNVAPSIDAITAPVDPVNINDQPVSVEVTFSDPGTADTHDVTWVWDGVSSDTQYGATSPASQAHTYAEAGVYVVTVTVTDDDGGSATQAYEFIVIYDPEGGFVTGGGWIDSPAGAYAPDQSLTGKANFGFVSKYKKGADTPTGETEFQFKVADLNFHSDSYDWLVVAGPKAMYKGVGTINGAGNYGFMLSAIDEKLTPSTDVDLFRIKIWDKDNDDVIVYDNQMGAEDDADPTTAIGGGSIVIHKE